MNTTQLDTDILLYKNNSMFDFFTILQDLESSDCAENIWQISSQKNINSTNLTDSSETFTIRDTRVFLKSQIKIQPHSPYFNLTDKQSSLHIKKLKLENTLNSFAFPFILNYLTIKEQKIKTIKQWTICKNIKASEFIDDQSRNDLLHNNTIIICLNGGYSGGEIQFKDRVGNDPITLNEGDVIIYPSGSDWSHKFYPITTGSQYLAIAYF
jgi:hypothetical protein